MLISLPQEASSLRTGSHQRTILACPRPCPARPRGRAGHCPTTSHDDGQVQTDTSAGPAQPAPASSARLRLGQTRSRSWTQRATTPTAAIPAVQRPAPPARSTTSLRPDTAGAGTHRHQTPTPDAGHRTPDSGHLDAPTAAPDTGHRSRGQASVDTGRSHRTLDAGHGRGRGQGDDGTAGIRTVLGHHAERPRAGTPNPVPVDGACGALSSCRLGGEAPSTAR